MPGPSSCTSEKIGPHFVKILKQSIECDPTGTGLPPPVVFCNQVSKEEYDSKLKDAYRYEVAGGLHSYTAKKELAEEYPQNRFYKTVEASVYAGLTDEQAPSMQCVFVCVCVCECVVCTFGVEKFIC